MLRAFGPKSRHVQPAHTPSTPSTPSLSLRLPRHGHNTSTGRLQRVATVVRGSDHFPASLHPDPLDLAASRLGICSPFVGDFDLGSLIFDLSWAGYCGLPYCACHPCGIPSHILAGVSPYQKHDTVVASLSWICLQSLQTL